MKARAGLALFALVFSCRRSSPVVDDAARAAEATETTPLATATAVPSATAIAGADAQMVIERWNSAHNAHDVDALASLYAPTVSFYGTSVSNAECANKKRLAFTATPDYTQSTRDAKLEPAEAGRTFVRLVKTSKTKGKSKDYAAILIIDASNKIVEESDDLSEGWCFGKDELQATGNDRVVAPFRMSSNDAMMKARSSKYFASLSKPVGDIRNLTCARRCALQTHECGFAFVLHDMEPHSMDDPTLTVSSWLGSVEVEPVTKTLWWQDFAADGASTWRSEQL
jgi:ketosteroid isomerase-like protein